MPMSVSSCYSFPFPSTASGQPIVMPVAMLALPLHPSSLCHEPSFFFFIFGWSGLRLLALASGTGGCGCEWMRRAAFSALVAFLQLHFTRDASCFPAELTGCQASCMGCAGSGVEAACRATQMSCLAVKSNQLSWLELSASLACQSTTTC